MHAEDDPNPLLARVRRGSATTVRSIVVGSIALALACRPEPAKSPRDAETGDTVSMGGSAGPRGRSLVEPDTLPPVPQMPPPAAALPSAAPKDEGRQSVMVAVDDQRAVAHFFRRYDQWIMLMNRDGSIAWIQKLEGGYVGTLHGLGIALVGDAVSVTTDDELTSDQSTLTLNLFALGDGSKRARISLGKGVLWATTTDGTHRFDVRTPHRGSKGAAQLIASDHRGVSWRVPLDELPMSHEHELKVIGDAVAVQALGPDDDHARWSVFDRRTGKLRGRLPARWPSCTNAERWFVLDDDGFSAVDPKTLRTRPVATSTRLPGLFGAWTLVDCSMAGGNPVLLVQRGYRQALVIFDGATLRPLGQVTLGSFESVKMGKPFEVIPDQLHPMAVIDLETEGRERKLLVIDTVRGREVERWSPRRQGVLGRERVVWPGGTFIHTEHTIALVDGRTGHLAGHLMRSKEGQVGQDDVVGTTLWVEDHVFERLGSHAPRVVDLSKNVSDAVRGSVLADLEPGSPSPPGLAGCPDPFAPLVGDGIEPPTPSGPARPARLPPWDLDLLHESARILACAPGSAPSRLMAWSRVRVAPSQVDDLALVAVEDTSVKPPRFTMLQLRRQGPGQPWMVNYSFEQEWDLQQTFDHRPTRAEVDAFLGAGWHFDDDGGTIVVGNVVDAEWKAATGLAPWRSYAKGIEQPN